MKYDKTKYRIIEHNVYNEVGDITRTYYTVQNEQCYERFGDVVMIAMKFETLDQGEEAIRKLMRNNPRNQTVSRVIRPLPETRHLI